MLLLMAACSAVSSGVFMAHSSSRPSRAPAVVITVSGASVLIDAVLKVVLPMTGGWWKFCHDDTQRGGGGGGEKKKKKSLFRTHDGQDIIV